jgi:hypothetical protein
LFALVGSLIFVGLQLRQEQEIALSQAYQARADQSIGLLVAALESDTTQTFWAKMGGMVDAELTPSEIAVAIQIARARLVHLENMHYQYQKGFVTQEHWDTQLAGMRNMMSNLEVRAVYENGKDIWRASFREVLDKIIREIDSKQS